MNNTPVVKPLRGSLDWHASVNAGWDPESEKNATYSLGNLSRDISEYESVFRSFINDVARLKPDLLNPLTNVAEPETFPEIEQPVQESMVTLDIATQEKTGLFPKAALWQSGWRNALPYIFVRQQVYDRLILAVNIFKEFNTELSLCITDGWRSVEQQTDLYNAFYPNGHVEGEPLYISVPSSDDTFAAPHPSGGAVDILLGLGDQAIRIGSELDYMDVQANTDHFENAQDNDLVKNMRRIFSNIMSEVGFVSIDSEWWHVEFGTRRWAGKLGNQPLYGNAVVNESLYAGYEPVTPIPGSRAAFTAN